MEELGKVIGIEPYLPTVVIAGGALKVVGGAQADAMIPEIIAGNAIVAFAYAEPQGRYDLANLRTAAKKDGAGYVLNGQDRQSVGEGKSVSVRVVSGGRRSIKKKK